ncbi:MAG: cupin domain-containing protein [Acidiferrobacteraceae bacterium]
MSLVKNTDSPAPVQNGQPVLHYWHIWTDGAGTSHQSRCALTAFERQSMGGASPQWNDSQEQGLSRVLFSVLPAGWVGEWHENPTPQWIVPISGCWFVESMDGMRIEMGPGELSFGGDQNCAPDAQGYKGHRSGTVGDQPAVLMIVQLDQAPSPPHRPCGFT